MEDSQKQAQKQALPGLSQDWPERTASLVSRWVERVRKVTDRPTANLARMLVYGSMLVVAGVAVLILAVIGGVRLIDAYLPAGVWAAYVILGGVFVGLGLWVWAKRPARAASPSAPE